MEALADFNTPDDGLTLFDECVAATVAAAAQCRVRDDNPGAVIASLELAGLLPLLGPGNAQALLFTVANAFGDIDLGSTWLASVQLADAVANAAGGVAGRVALGSPEHGWTLLEPMSRTGPVSLFEPGAMLFATDAVPPVAQMLGFSAGAVRTFPAATVTAATASPADGGESFLADHIAILLGLIAAGVRRAVDTSFTYARDRQVGGQPIAQYQAVALRLADLAIAGRAIARYTEALAHALGNTAADPDLRCDAAAAAVVTDLAFRVGRDAVQTAGGHGYVAGLPMRPLFEQLRALTAALQTTVEARTLPRAPSESTVA